MLVNIGLDTSFIIGLLDEKDLWHASALEVNWLKRIARPADLHDSK